MRRVRRRIGPTDRTGGESLAVLHVSHTGEGGVGKCVADFARDQIVRGWRVTVATEPASRLAREATDAGAVTLPWVASREPSARLPNEILALRRIVADTEPDVVHLHSSKGGLCGRLLIRGRLPTMFQPHGWSFEAAERLLERLAVGWERFGARWADATVCVSHAEADRGRQKGIGGPYRVIANGVDLTRFTQADTTGQSEARRRLGLTDQLLVVCVGRLSRAKGQDVLAASWPTVRERVPGAELALVGDGEDMERLRGEGHPGILITGHRDDVVDWLAAADVVAVPSRWEGMSLGMLEAMASGRSIVVTDVPGAREALDGVGGIVPTEDPPALAEAIVERLRNPARREAEGLAAAQRARSDFDLRLTLQRIADLSLEVSRATAPEHRP